MKLSPIYFREHLLLSKSTSSLAFLFNFVVYNVASIRNNVIMLYSIIMKDTIDTELLAVSIHIVTFMNIEQFCMPNGPAAKIVRVPKSPEAE